MMGILSLAYNNPVYILLWHALYAHLYKFFSGASSPLPVLFGVCRFSARLSRLPMALEAFILALNSPTKHRITRYVAWHAVPRVQ